MTFALTMAVLSAAFVGSLAASPSNSPAGDARRTCLSPAETRESVFVNHLREPMTLLREAAIQARAEPLGARLCRWNEQFVYEMSLLRRDGRVVRVFVDAASGARLVARDRPER